jgi:hypothetical protein
MADAELLERFEDRDREASQLAFAELVARHSPMVLVFGSTSVSDAAPVDISTALAASATRVTSFYAAGATRHAGRRCIYPHQFKR